MKPILKPLLAVAALLLVGAPAASASTGLGWDVEAKELLSGETKALAENVSVKNHFSIAWSGTAVTCSELKLKGARLIGSEDAEFARGEAEHFVFAGCIETSVPTKCEVKPIETNPLKLLLETGVKVKIVPKEGNVLGTMTIAKKHNEVCTLAGNHKLTGSLTAQLPGAGSETVKQELAFGGASGSALSVDEIGALFEGWASVELETKQAWAID